MTAFHLSAFYEADPPPTDWRALLAHHVGNRVRRLGSWAELGLHGALACLATAGESQLPAEAGLLVCSQHGPAMAMRSAVMQGQGELPMPLTFVQTQPSQLLATLSAQLQWCGDGRFVAQADPLAVLQLALAMAEQQPGGLLLGWVNELDTPHTRWLRLLPTVEPVGEWQPLSDMQALRQSRFLRAGQQWPEQMISGAKPQTATGAWE